MIVNQANLAGIYRTFSTIFNQAFGVAESMVDLIAMRVPSTGRSMREWVGDRVVKDLSGFHYELVNKPYESTIEVDRDDIDDDQVGVYTPMVQGLARAAKVHPDLLAFALLAVGFSTVCYDGQYFFDTDHPLAGGSYSNSGGGSGNPWFLMDLSQPLKPVILQTRKAPQFVAMDRPDDEQAFMRKKYRYGVDDRKNVGLGLWQLAYGSRDTLSEEHYLAGRSALMGVTNDEGVKLGLRTTHLIVGATNESAGKNIVEKQNKTGGESNIWYDTAKLVVCPWLV
jgi:phage major head subunit gpT-like protein